MIYIVNSIYVTVLKKLLLNQVIAVKKMKYFANNGLQNWSKQVKFLFFLSVKTGRYISLYLRCSVSKSSILLNIVNEISKEDEVQISTILLLLVHVCRVGLSTRYTYNALTVIRRDFAVHSRDTWWIIIIISYTFIVQSIRHSALEIHRPKNRNGFAYDENRRALFARFLLQVV